MSADRILTDGVKIIYLYRDADNYKFFGEFCLIGSITISQFEDYLFDREYFIPSKIGFDDLQPIEKTDADHLLHEIVEINQELVQTGIMSTDKFIERLRSVSLRGWFNESKKMD